MNEELRKTIWISGIQVLIVTVNFAANIVLALTLGGLGLVILHIIVNIVTAALCLKQFSRRCNAAGII